MIPEPLLTQARSCVYEHFLRHDGAPTVRQVAEELSLDSTVARDVFEELARRRTLVLDPHSREIWMAMPFSAVPTGVCVRSGAHIWWANCAWDALGIPAMLASDALIEGVCQLSGEILSLRVGPEGPVPGQPGAPTRVHFAVPAARWWEDIGHT